MPVDNSDVPTEVLTDLLKAGEWYLNGLIIIRDPKALERYGWKAPFPSYVVAAPKLWNMWQSDFNKTARSS